MAPIAEIQGLKELPYNGTSVGSLVPEQGSLIDTLLDGSWRTVSQNRGTMGSVKTPLPDQTVKAPESVSLATMPKWIVPVIGVVLALLLLRK